MRASILLWSMASGLILGLFIDATLIGVALLLSAAMPGVTERFNHRWLITSSTMVLVAIPLFMAVLGYLEGQLKAT